MAQKIDRSPEQKQVHGHKARVARPLFTGRERTILMLMANGLSNQEIADRLTLSPTTIKWYIKQIFNKLGASRRTHAVKLAQDLNLLETLSDEYNPIAEIPAPLIPLIGREREMSEIHNLLNDPMVRLVTILGPGGIGKTRLAIDVARQLGKDNTGHVCYVTLDSISSLQGMIQAIARAIGFQFHGNLEIGRQLVVNFRNRRLTLVLDNFEHLPDCSSFINEMLASASHVKILATSRERLDLSGETVYALHGLAYPSSNSQPETYPAYILFMQMAHYSQPTYRPVAADISHICQICRLVEGLPLAIELAARWIDLLTPARIEEEIKQGISLFQTTWQDLPERQRSLRAVFEHSWQLLSDLEQAVLRRLCVFRSGFDLAAAEQVAAADLFVLSTLVDKSLVTRVSENRFKLHELIRLFALEKLKSDEDEYKLVLHKHCQYFAGLLDSYEKRIKTDVSTLSEIIMRIQEDHDNILAGWHHALDAALMKEMGEFVFTISAWFQARGLNAEARQSFSQALHLLDADPAADELPIRVRLLTHYGWFLQTGEQLELACQVLQEAMTCSSIMDSSHAADVSLLFIFWASALALSHRLDDARENTQKGLAASDTANFQFGVWMCFTILGEIEHAAEHYQAASEYHRQALIHAEEYGNLLGQIQSLTHLGCICCDLGQVEDAIAYLQQGLTYMHTFFNVDTVFLTLLGIAAIHCQRSRPEAALEFLAIVVHHPQNDSPVLASTTGVLMKHLQTILPMEHIESVMDIARRGQLSSGSLDPHFSISSELLYQLDALLENASNR